MGFAGSSATEFQGNDRRYMYRAGFATTQAAYEAAVQEDFDTPESSVDQS
jgi:glutathionyl-hydroquinone reductase